MLARELLEEDAATIPALLRAAHHRVELSRVCAHGEERVIAAGTLSGAGSGGSASFWAAENLENGRIVVAHHYSDRFPS